VRFKRVVGLGLALAFACCSGGNLHTLDGPALRASNPRTLAVLRSPSPAFATGNVSMAMIPLTGLLPWLVATAITDDTVYKTVKGGDLEDPAVAISARLAAALSKRFSLSPVVSQGPRPLVYLDGPASSPVPLPDADLVLEVRSTGWGFHLVGRGRYGVTYDGSFRLLDLRTRAVLAEGFCAQHPVADDDGPTYKELAANDAALLRRLLQSITDTCADDYRTRILGLYE
jgi:hypothetical protein